MRDQEFVIEKRRIMLKKICMAIFGLVLCVGLVDNAVASLAPVDPIESGRDGNYKPTIIDGVEVYELAKIDNGLLSGDFRITYYDEDDSPYIGGTWTSTGAFVDYVLVKGSQSWAIFKFDSASTGQWYTKWGTDYGESLLNNGGNVPGLSHITFYRRQQSTATVPVPAAAWLLGAGLIGLGGIRRKYTAQ
ncbi:MAG: VPLPA-CTERM sorting domain-containing protein [Desulfobacterium sp.]|nr:VPLPA-CTERM sorting domain-containing protein [Desulfobacterium sp.]